MYAISSRQTTVRKGNQEILHGLTFDVEPGTVTGLIGPSGSGKTTLMRAIVGVQELSGGFLNVLGLPAGVAQLRSRIGYVTQDPAVYSDVSVEENLKYFGALVRASKEGIDQVLRDVDLIPQRKQLAASLSGGQRARVSLALALLGNPELLVLDEPTVGLDPILRNDLWDMFERLAHGGKTILVSSHVMDEAQRCEQLILLRDGDILWHDSRDKLLQKTRLDTVGEAFVKTIKETAR